MVADDLAFEISRKHIPANSKVLDPFCGTGRFLAAATQASLLVGIDANPLAWLVSRAKFSRVSAASIASLVERIPAAQESTPQARLNNVLKSKVDWFADEVFLELGRIVYWINSLNLKRPLLAVVAVALSAAVRDVSFARKSGWKLHRMAASERDSFRACPWSSLRKRLQLCAVSVANTKLGDGRAKFILGDTIDTTRKDGRLSCLKEKFDVVVTSPPYGDSFSTVQYGAASALSLSVICQLKGFEGMYRTGSEIDKICLGGKASNEVVANLNRYWSGGRDNVAYKSVNDFLLHFALSCTQISSLVRRKGRAIFVVARRSTGGFRVRLDDFLVDVMQANGFSLMETTTRRLRQKRFPTHSNRFARSHKLEKRLTGRTSSMSFEIVLVLQKR